jgi:hypothetical protein
MGKGNREQGTENQEQGTERAVGWGLSLWGGEEESGKGTGLCQNRREEMEMALDMRRWQLQNRMWILALIFCCTIILQLLYNNSTVLV